jgi:hypothetical protein
MKRKDTHRPSAIIPQDYRFVAFIPAIVGFEDVQVVIEERKILLADMARTEGRWSNHAHGGSCHICGASANTMVVFHHMLTNTYVEVGATCAHKLEFSGNDLFNRFREELKQAADRKAGKAKAEWLLAEAGLSRAWELSRHDFGDNPMPAVWTLRDVVGSVVKYGNLSEKQAAFLKTLVDQIDNHDAELARRAAEHALAEPCPVTDARITIAGTVLSTKWQETFNGDVLKMLVQTDAGWKVWGTVPAAIDSVKRGARVSFSAALTISEDDPKFGFFSRPTKAVICDEASVAA